MEYAVMPANQFESIMETLGFYQHSVVNGISTWIMISNNTCYELHAEVITKAERQIDWTPENVYYKVPATAKAAFDVKGLQRNSMKAYRTTLAAATYIIQQAVEFVEA